jgi:hypothetical protein
MVRGGGAVRSSLDLQRRRKDLRRPRAATDQTGRPGDLRAMPSNASAVIARSIATKQSTLPLSPDGLIRGACLRARIRATRWLAMTGDRSNHPSSVMPRAGGASSTPCCPCDSLLPAFTGSSAGACHRAAIRPTRWRMMTPGGVATSPPPRSGRTAACALPRCGSRAGRNSD